MTQDNRPCRSRNPTDRSNAERSAHRPRTATALAAPSSMVTTRNTAALVSEATTGWDFTAGTYDPWRSARRSQPVKGPGDPDGSIRPGSTDAFASLRSIRHRGSGRPCRRFRDIPNTPQGAARRGDRGTVGPMVARAAAPRLSRRPPAAVGPTRAALKRRPPRLRLNALAPGRETGREGRPRSFPWRRRRGSCP